MTAPSSGPGVFGPEPYVSKSDVLGRVVAVLRGVSDRRGLVLESYRSRAVSAGQVHELLSTDRAADAGEIVDDVAIIAFFEVVAGGVALVGDEVELAGREVGSVLGFNDTHMPNHQNICLLVNLLCDGETLGLQPGDTVRIGRS